jgi:hypothetical protein
MIITQNLKNLYKSMIDEILSINGLTNKCTLYYQGSENYCNNCIFDKSSNVSSNVYNNTGPAPFDDYALCPVCMGSGKVLLSNITKELYLAVIIDSRSFINFPNKLVNIPDGTIQIISDKKYSEDLRKCSYLIIESDLNTKYERMNDINLVGLGDLNYIFMNWKRV